MSLNKKTGDHDEPVPTAEDGAGTSGKLRRRLRALGVWGFLFFLVKGLLWLAIPAAIAAWRWLSG